MIYIVIFYDNEAEDSLSSFYFEEEESAKRYADSVMLNDENVYFSGYNVITFENGEDFVRTH